jgi:protein-cysteine N-palmitoyltransferase HHAT
MGKLSKGWIFGRQLDNSDSQYSSFRQNIPILVAVAILHQIISKIVNVISFSKSIKTENLVQHHQVKKFPLRLKWSLLFSAIFLTALFGASFLKIIVILTAQYKLIKWNPKLIPYTTWIFGISILFLNDYYKGYRFGSISSLLSFLDELKGVGMRWNITFNFTVLRMISFSMDYYWALTKSQDLNISYYTHCKTCVDCQTDSLCKRQRLEKPHSIGQYHYWNYLAYCLYAPLFMAGPILSANDFLHQVDSSPKSISIKSTIFYGARWIGAVLIMEVMMHYLYVVAIKDTKAWKGYSPIDMYLVGYFNLKLIWLKLLIIWRFFRVWAMSDGIETMENMGRCMSNHYSGVDFWREWHSSFNRWLVRYLYVPLGGSKYKGLNMFPIFSFVAIWHDIEGRLLAWGWLIALFILPEMSCHALFTTDRVINM